MLRERLVGASPSGDSPASDPPSSNTPRTRVFDFGLSSALTALQPAAAGVDYANTSFVAPLSLPPPGDAAAGAGSYQTRPGKLGRAGSFSDSKSSSVYTPTLKTQDETVPAVKTSSPHKRQTRSLFVSTDTPQVHQRSLSLPSARKSSLSSSSPRSPASDASPEVEFSPLHSARGSGNRKRASFSASSSSPSSQSSHTSTAYVDDELSTSAGEAQISILDNDTSPTSASPLTRGGSIERYSLNNSPSPRHQDMLIDAAKRAIASDTVKFPKKQTAARPSLTLLSRTAKLAHWLQRQATRCGRCCLNTSLCKLRHLTGKQLTVRAFRCSFFFLLFLTFFILSIIGYQLARTSTIYSNRVCVNLNEGKVNYTWPETTPHTNYHLLYQNGAGARGPLAILSSMLASFLGTWPFLYYTSSSLLSAVNPQIRVPTNFTSSAPHFVPNYTNSPILDLPFYMFRTLGSHNSYHMPSSYPISPHQYAHAPLTAQLGDYTDGVRQVELDIHVLPGNGGSVVYHVQFIDDHTNCYCLSECLTLLRIWLEHYPRTFPVLLMIEYKRQAYEDLTGGFNGLTCNDLYNLEIALMSIFSEPSQYLLPSTVRGAFPNLTSALSYQNYVDRKTNRYNNTKPEDFPTPQEDANMAGLEEYAKLSNDSYGWPLLRDMLGKVVFIWLDDVWNYADRLPCVANDTHASQHALLFVAQANINKSYNAVLIIRNILVEQTWELIHVAASRRNMITRGLSTLASFRKRDPREYELSMALGIHVISTDFEPPCAGNHRSVNTSGNATNDDDSAWLDTNVYGSWCERLPTGWPYECNPLLAPAWCAEELQQIRLPALRSARNATTIGFPRIHQEQQRPLHHQSSSVHTSPTDIG